MIKKFNLTQDTGVDWARFTWNPYTGCLHGCSYCYARQIANRFPNNFGGPGFKPTFHPDRLDAPANTTIPRKYIGTLGANLVFVCSMADLFGSWVPLKIIQIILGKVAQHPQWKFIFLTKNPKRLIEFDFPGNAWVGATVDRQARVDTSVNAFQKISATIKFLSCEPLLGDLDFNGALGDFDWVIIGAQSTGGTTIQPHDIWVEHLVQQARDSGCLIYCKANLKHPAGLPLKEIPEH